MHPRYSTDPTLRMCDRERDTQGRQNDNSHHTLALVQVYTKAEVLALRRKVETMDDTEREAFHDEWSRVHHGQWFGRYPILPFHAKVPDTLHLTGNEFNDALDELFQSHLVEPHTDQEIKARQATALQELNAYLRTPKAEGGAGITGLRFGADFKRVNGPVSKQLMRDPIVMPTMFEKMMPLYNAMEAKEHESVRPPALTREDQQARRDEEIERRRAEKAAAEAQAQAAPKRGRGQKKVDKRKKKGHAKKGKKARLPAVRPVRLGSAASDDESDGDADGDAGGDDDAEAGSVSGSGGDHTSGAHSVGPESGDTCRPCEGEAHPTYAQRAARHMHAFLELYTFLHQNELETSTLTPELIEKRWREAAHLGLELATAAANTIGTKRRRTYTHDVVYCWR